jgi:hypothetical protein
LKVAIRPSIMEFIPIKVESYSGYKADEYPKCFYRNNNRVEIVEITDQWYQGDRNPEWPVSDYFRVVTASGVQHIIKHDLKSDEWYLGQ